MINGSRIKDLRLSKGLTLENLGKQIGVVKSTVRKWETGVISNIRLDTLLKLADALEVSPEEICSDYVFYQKVKFPEIDSISHDELNLIRLFRCAPKDIQDNIITELLNFETVEYEYVPIGVKGLAPVFSEVGPDALISENK